MKHKTKNEESFMCTWHNPKMTMSYLLSNIVISSDDFEI